MFPKGHPLDYELGSLLHKIINIGFPKHVNTQVMFKVDKKIYIFSIMLITFFLNFQYSMIEKRYAGSIFHQHIMFFLFLFFLLFHALLFIYPFIYLFIIIIIITIIILEYIS